MKSVVKVGLIFLAGVMVGSIAIAFLSSRASTEYLAIVKMHYEMQQELEGHRSFNRKDFSGAVFHFTNLVNSQEGDEILAFQEGYSKWPLSFPFAAEILRKIRQVNDPEDIGKNRIIGITRGLLGTAYEKQGDTEMANIQYQKGIEHWGGKGIDTQKLKKVVEVNITTYKPEVIQSFLDSMSSE
ncbi:MAG: hypothetical protein GY705_03690 [Bacteroidetes bacterium]|nr:hypothetical protein [Bacteroidota bacterium]